MGFDLTRFVGEVDEELQCSICSMVFENPVQTPCEHAFCNECITTWLSNNTACPIDRKPLSQCELKAPGRLLRSFFAKLDIKCNFDVDGCEAIVKLEHLEDHLKSCHYNPIPEITCNKGCKMKIRKCEYEEHNCITFLANRISHQEDEITKLNSEQINQNVKSTCQEEEITKLKEMINKELSGLKEQIAVLEEVLSRQLENIPKAGGNSTVLSNKTPKWKVWKNEHFLGQCNILECDRYPGVAQSYFPLGPANSSFKVEILRVGGDIVTGLSPADELEATFDLADSSSKGVLCNSGGSAFFRFGRYSFDKIAKFIVIAGDIIECGIKCPENFHENETMDIAVYFSKNGKFCYEKVVQLRSEHLFPTVSCYGRGSKVKILSN